MTLKDAINALDLSNDDMLYICLVHGDMNVQPMTIKQIEDRYDTARIGVKKIYPYHFLHSDALNWEIIIQDYNEKPTPNDLVSLWDVEQTLCMNCSRSVIAICPNRGNEPENPEKTTCPTIQRLRILPRYERKTTDDTET